MKGNKLYKGMNYLDEDLIQEACEYPEHTDSERHSPVMILMEAAVILFFAALVFFSTVSINRRSGNTAVPQTPPLAVVDTTPTSDDRTDPEESVPAGKDFIPISEYFSTHQFRERETTAAAPADTVTILGLIILSLILLLSVYWMINKKLSVKRAASFFLASCLLFLAAFLLKWDALATCFLAAACFLTLPFALRSLICMRTGRERLKAWNIPLFLLPCLAAFFLLQPFPFHSFEDLVTYKGPTQSSDFGEITCYTPSDLLIVRQEMNIGQIQTISFRIAYGSEAYGELQEMLTGQVFLHDLNHPDSWEFPAADVYYLIAAPAYTIHADSNNNLLIKARTAYVKAGFPVSVKKDLSGELDRILQSAEGVMVEKERSGAK